MMDKLRNEIKKMILGKDADFDIFSPLSKSNEDTMSAIGHSSEDHKKYLASINQMFQGLEVAINNIERQNNLYNPDYFNPPSSI
jgi:hypothetical protein